MDPDVKQRWIAALRSHEYTQTTGHLRNRTGYCCLGVLCDLYDPSEWDQATNTGPYGFKYSYAQLPADVYRWAGLPGCDPHVTIDCSECGGREDGCTECFGKGEALALSELNDSRWTFDRIADVIEEQL